MLYAVVFSHFNSEMNSGRHDLHCSMHLGSSSCTDFYVGMDLVHFL